MVFYCFLNFFTPNARFLLRHSVVVLSTLWYSVYGNGDEYDGPHPVPLGYKEIGDYDAVLKLVGERVRAIIGAPRAYVAYTLAYSTQAPVFSTHAVSVGRRGGPSVCLFLYPQNLSVCYCLHHHHHHHHRHQSICSVVVKDLRLEDKDEDLKSEARTRTRACKLSLRILEDKNSLEDCQQDWVTMKNGLLTL